MDVGLMALPVVGFLIGALVTLFGGGGGAVYLPVLIVGFGVPYKVAVPTSIATIIPTTLFGSIGHFRDGNVAWRLGSVVVVGTIGGTYLGTQLAGLFANATLERAFGLFLLVIAGVSILRGDGLSMEQEGDRRVRAVLAIAVGVVAGIATALFGISGTPVLLPGLSLLGLSARVVVGTSVFVILGNAISGVFWYAELQGIDWRLVVLFGSGTALGAIVAPRFYRYMPEEAKVAGYETLFGTVLVLTALAFLFGLV
ncbi:hypothetical protein SAMN05216388_1009133 [Halorientalis persicus]|uniref:Probable membrane transporter protein n=1 Tax=Halorientalis persicus TaxID=1367881 RepID=A0A1H8MUZ8_9EURY|nr:sulfite exporter TauE/SafE family protein [Halorientalis persicus]SEO21084.1 hypothetical protein SAMN05216388_1009133 [Halorientalis persicus]